MVEQQNPHNEFQINHVKIIVHKQQNLSCDIQTNIGSIQSSSQIQNLIGQLEFFKDCIENQSFTNNHNIPQSTFLNNLQSIIYDNLDNDKLTVNFLCAKMGLSKMQLHRKIKKEKGLSISLFIQEIRLQKSYELLEKKRDSISDIAYKTGFTSLAYFSRAFKKRFNTPPSALLK